MKSYIFFEIIITIRRLGSEHPLVILGRCVAKLDWLVESLLSIVSFTIDRISIFQLSTIFQPHYCHVVVQAIVSEKTEINFLSKNKTSFHTFGLSGIIALRLTGRGVVSCRTLVENCTQPNHCSGYRRLVCGRGGDASTGQMHFNHRSPRCLEALHAAQGVSSYFRKENIFRLLQLDDVKAYVRVGGQRRGRRSCRLIRVR